MSTGELWRFLPIGYLATIAIEGPILLVGLTREHSLGRRLWAALWLTACTYPVVVLVLPTALPSDCPRWGYLALAETFAPLAECLLFWLAFDRGIASRRTLVRDMAVIALANLASFAAGELVRAMGQSWLA